MSRGLFNERSSTHQLLPRHSTFCNPPLPIAQSVILSLEQELAHIGNTQRKTFACMTIVLDEVVQNMTDTLNKHGMYDDTFIVIASDNGANPQISSAGSNFPLRGYKMFLFEGAFRIHAVVRSKLIPENLRGATHDGLFHVTGMTNTPPNMMLHLFGAKLCLCEVRNLTLSPGVDRLDPNIHWHAQQD